MTLLGNYLKNVLIQNLSQKYVEPFFIMCTFYIFIYIFLMFYSLYTFLHTYCIVSIQISINISLHISVTAKLHFQFVFKLRQEITYNMLTV